MKLLHLRSDTPGSVPSAAQVTEGQLVINSADAKLFIKKTDGTIAEIASAENIADGGTVTSVGMSVPSVLTVAGSPVTASGTLAVDLATQPANLVFSGPGTGADAKPTFRALTSADLPTTVGSLSATNPAWPVSVFDSPSGTQGYNPGGTSELATRDLVLEVATDTAYSINLANTDVTVQVPAEVLSKTQIVITGVIGTNPVVVELPNGGHWSITNLATGVEEGSFIDLINTNQLSKGGVTLFFNCNASISTGDYGVSLTSGAIDGNGYKLRAPVGGGNVNLTNVELNYSLIDVIHDPAGDPATDVTFTFPSGTVPIQTGVWTFNNRFTADPPKIALAGANGGSVYLYPGLATTVYYTADGILNQLYASSPAINAAGVVNLPNATDTGVAAGQGSSAVGTGVAVGDSATASTSGVALGYKASSSGNSVSIGANSIPSTYVDALDHVSFGNDNGGTGTLYRRLTGVADGAHPHDAVTIGQINWQGALGTMSLQNSTNVSISGGQITAMSTINATAGKIQQFTPVNLAFALGQGFRYIDLGTSGGNADIQLANTMYVIDTASATAPINIQFNWPLTTDGQFITLFFPVGSNTVTFQNTQNYLFKGWSPSTLTTIPAEYKVSLCGDAASNTWYRVM